MYVLCTYVHFYVYSVWSVSNLLLFISIYFVRTHMKSVQDGHKPVVDIQLRNLGQIMHKTFHSGLDKKKLKIHVSEKVRRKEKESR